MFSFEDNVFRSDLLDLPGVKHAFSTRLGGVSTEPNVQSMNVAPGRGDSPENVRANMDILAGAVGGTAEDTVCTRQIHSNLLRYVTAANRGEGAVMPNPYQCDGFYTDSPGVILMVRTADCAPVILAGLREDGSPAVCAMHAGWRGTAAGICAMGYAAMISMNVIPSTIRAAIGPCAHFENFEVGEDMRDQVIRDAGREIADRFVREVNGKLHADVAGMNAEFLRLSGVAADAIDICPRCTIAEPEVFHSHRASAGNRGAMGNVVTICDRDR